MTRLLCPITLVIVEMFSSPFRATPYPLDGAHRPSPSALEPDLGV